jgi:hypothetical protein
MKRLLYMLTAALLCLLSAVGAADLTLRLDLAEELATLAGITAFVVNFFMIEPVRRQWQTHSPS